MNLFSLQLSRGNVQLGSSTQQCLSSCLLKLIRPAQARPAACRHRGRRVGGWQCNTHGSLGPGCTLWCAGGRRAEGHLEEPLGIGQGLLHAVAKARVIAGIQHRAAHAAAHQQQPRADHLAHRHAEGRKSKSQSAADTSPQQPGTAALLQSLPINQAPSPWLIQRQQLTTCPLNIDHLRQPHCNLNPNEGHAKPQDNSYQEQRNKTAPCPHTSPLSQEAKEQISSW